MRIEFSLNRPIARVALAVLAFLTCGLLLVLTAIHFVVSVYAFPRTTLTRDEVSAAAAYLPNAPELQALLAEVEMAEASDHKASAERAITAANRAVNLSPARYDYHMLLSVARELNGDRTGAVASMRDALSRAPNRAELQWRLANLLVRNQKLDESLPLYARTVSSRPVLLTQTLNLLWALSDGRLDVVEKGVGETPKARIDLAFFLLRKGKLGEAVAIFKKIPPETRREMDETQSFITGVMLAGQLQLAKDLWGELIADKAEETNPAVFNGSFERDGRKILDHFDWAIGSNQWMRAGIDPSVSHSGKRSLRIDFLGVDTTRMDREIRQQIVVLPGHRYTLECFVKAELFSSPEGPHLAVTSIDGSQVYASSEQVASGTYDWKKLSVDFSVPVGMPTVLISIKRTPQFKFDDPSRGSLWFDDFAVIEAGGKN